MRRALSFLFCVSLLLGGLQSAWALDAAPSTALDAAPSTAPAATSQPTHIEDVIYGRKMGTALTMEVYLPKANANGAGIVLVNSGGWISDHSNTGFAMSVGGHEFMKRGYAVFVVTHGSQPQFTISDAVADITRAVRFIRFHAKDYSIDKDRIGITGGSAGGHLSLMMGTTGNDGDANGRDPVDKTSSRVQAVACFFPPTDFLNYGEEGKNAFALNGLLTGFRVAADLRQYDGKTHRLEHLTDDQQVELLKKISPITHVDAKSAPTLIIHGDADKLVPIQQAESFLAKMKAAGVPAELVVKKGGGHGWNLAADAPVIADWFDKYLKPHD